MNESDAGHNATDSRGGGPLEAGRAIDTQVLTDSPTAEQLFADFMAEHQLRLYQQVRRMTTAFGHPELAEDVVAEVMVKIYRRLTKNPASWTHLEQPMAYLMVSARNEAWRTIIGLNLNELRQHRPVLPDRVQDDTFSVPGPESEIVNRDWLMQQLDKLPLRQRTALWLRYVEGWSISEIARQQTISGRSVSHDLQRGLLSLREAQKPGAGDAELGASPGRTGGGEVL